MQRSAATFAASSHEFSPQIDYSPLACTALLLSQFAQLPKINPKLNISKQERMLPFLIMFLSSPSL